MNEYHYKNIINNSILGICLVNENFNLTYANPTLLRMLGYLEHYDEFLHRPITNYLVDNSRTQFIELLNEIPSKKKAINSEIEIKHYNGNILHFDISCSTFELNRENLFQVTFFTNNLKDYPQDKWLEINQNIIDVFDHNPLPISILNLKTGELIDVNTSFVDNFGYSKEKLLSTNFISNGIVVNQEGFKNALSLALNQGYLIDYPIKIYNSDNQIKTVLLNASKLYPNNQEIFIVSLLDVTLRKEAIQHLWESEFKFSMAFHKSPAPNSILNMRTGERLMVNDSFCRVFEYSQEEMKRRDLTIGNLAYDQKELKIAWNKVLDEKGLYQYPFKMVAKSGIVKYIEVSAVQLYSNNSDIYLFTYVDATERTINKFKLIERENALKKIIQATSRKSGQSFFNAMARVLEEVTKASYSFIGEYEKNKIRTISFASNGKILQNLSYDLKGTPCKNVIDRSTCVFKNNVAELFPNDKSLIKMGIKAYVGTPLFNSKHECIGILVSLYKNAIKEDEFVSTIFELFASTIASEIERLKIEEVSQLSEYKERERLSKELHDGLGPIITTSLIYLHALRSENDFEKQQSLSIRAEELLKDANKTIREISNKLSPDLLKRYGIVRAIQSFVERLEDVSKTSFSFRFNTAEQRYSSLIENTIFRVVIELINNSLKHAGANEIKIDFDSNENSLDISYSDNGVGFDYEKIKLQYSGFGLANLENRIKNINGEYEFKSALGDGVKVKIYVPT